MGNIKITGIKRSGNTEYWTFERENKPKTEVAEMNDDILRIKALEAQILRSKKEKLKEVITGRVPKSMHKSVMNLADSLGNPHGLKPIEFSDSEGKKTERSALDILIEIFESIGVSLNLSDEDQGERIDLTKYV